MTEECLCISERYQKKTEHDKRACCLVHVLCFVIGGSVKSVSAKVTTLTYLSVYYRFSRIFFDQESVFTDNRCFEKIQIRRFCVQNFPKIIHIFEQKRKYTFGKIFKFKLRCDSFGLFSQMVGIF